MEGYRPEFRGQNKLGEREMDFFFNFLLWTHSKASIKYGHLLPLTFLSHRNSKLNLGMSSFLQIEFLDSEKKVFLYVCVCEFFLRYQSRVATSLLLYKTKMCLVLRQNYIASEPKWGNNSKAIHLTNFAGKRWTKIHIFIYYSLLICQATGLKENELHCPRSMGGKKFQVNLCFNSCKLFIFHSWNQITSVEKLLNFGLQNSKWQPYMRGERVIT